MSYVAGIGKINVDLIYGNLSRLPRLGEELYSETFGTFLGGGTPATLVNLGRLGVPVKLGTYLGKDMFSAFARARLEELGISVENLFFDEGIPLNVTAVMLTEGDRTFVTNGEEVKDLSSRDVGFFDTLCGAKLAIMKLDNENMYAKLKEKNVRLLLDTGFEEGMTVAKYAPYLRLATYYLPNRKEALTITGKATIPEAAEVLSEYLSTVIIKLDGEGTFVYERGEGHVVPSVSVTQVDPTGAGDAFLAGFCYGLYHDFRLDDCVRAGNLTGARCVTAKGCLSAYLTEPELLAALRG